MRTTVVFVDSSPHGKSNKIKKEFLSPIYYSYPLVIPHLKKMGMSLDDIIRRMYQREHFRLVPLSR